MKEDQYGCRVDKCDGTLSRACHVILGGCGCLYKIRKNFKVEGLKLLIY